MMYQHQNYKISLTALSPIHIGNGESLSSTGEYLTTEDYVYFLNHNALMERLREEELFEEYLAKIIHEKDQFDFYKILKEWNIDPLSMEERKLRLYQSGLNPSSNNILYQHIKTDNQVYLPGSSLKGAFRSAILFQILSDNASLLREIDKKLNNLLDQDCGLNDLKFFWTKKEKTLIPDRLSHMIRCGDSLVVEDSSLSIEQINRQSITGVETEGLDWLEECIATESQTKFDFTLYTPKDSEDTYFSLIKNMYPEKLFDLLNKHSECLIRDELKLVQTAKFPENIKLSITRQLTELLQELEASENKYAITRLGKGKTIFFQTILSILNDSTKDKIIELMTNKEVSTFPASRVLTVKNRLMKGWVKLEYTEPERNLIDNIVEGKLELGTRLIAYWVKKKTVELKINGVIITNVQLVNKTKKPFEPGDKLTVSVKQLKGDGTINQLNVEL